MIMLFIATTFSVAAQSNLESKFFGMSNLPLSAIDAGTADNTVVNQAGMTGKQVHNLLDAWCNYRVKGLTLHKLLTEGRKEAITVAHANCEALPNGLHPYWDNSPNGEVWMWEGSAILKDECGGNLVASSEGVIANFLANYAKKIPGQGSPVVTIPGGQPDQQNNKKDTMDVYHHFHGGMQCALPSCGTGVADTTPWGWIIFGIIAVLAILTIGGIVLMSIMNNRRNAHREMLQERNDNINGHYNEVGQFLRTARQMNLDNADNVRQVHNTMTYINPPQDRR